MIKDFTDDNFLVEVIEASKSKPVLVDFFALWCGQCKLLDSIIDQLAEEIGEKAVVGKMNVEEAVKTAEEYGIMSVPISIVFKDGKVVETITGLQNKDSLMAQIKKYL
ncbi:MAG: thioredoxin domain-containing protein [Candidatus Falkowbacteria bacterium]|nr:thioredoxin domain-containing protein [Candidatus Falkowbacteria bacterium]